VCPQVTGLWGAFPADRAEGPDGGTGQVPALELNQCVPVNPLSCM